MTTVETPPAAPPQFRLRCALAYVAPLSVNGILLPYLPVWLHAQAFSAFQIGTILAMQMILRVLASPLTGMVAGLFRDPAAILVWSSALSLLAMLGLFLTDGFWFVLFIVGVQAALFAPYGPIVEAIAVSGVRRWGFHYGSMRVWGSIGFVATTMAAGTLASAAGADAIPVAAAAALAGALAIAFVVPKGDAKAQPRRPGLPRSTGGMRPSPIHVLLIGASLIQSSHGMFYGFSTIQWQEMGFSSASIALLWSLGVAAEIVVFFVSGSLATRFSPLLLMQIGCLGAIARWLLFPFEWSVWGYAVLQIGHALSFALVHLGLQHRLVELVGEADQPAAQGVYVFYNGMMLALSTLLSGLLYRQAGLYGYFAMAGLAAAGLVVSRLAERHYPHSAGSGG